MEAFSAIIIKIKIKIININSKVKIKKTITPFRALAK